MPLIPELFSIRPEDLARKQALEEAGIHADFLMGAEPEPTPPGPASAATPSPSGSGQAPPVSPPG
jgi:hypothetical protein